MTGLAAAASTLEHLPLPFEVVSAIDGDLAAVEQLTAAVVEGTGAAEVLGWMQGARVEAINHANAGLRGLQHALRATAAEIRATPSASAEGAGRGLKAWRAAALAEVARPRHQDKDIEGGLRRVEQLGYGVEQRSNRHFHVHCPCGDCPTVIIASTPRSTSTALGLLRRTAARGCHTRRAPT